MNYPKFYKHNTRENAGFFTAIMGETESIKVCTFEKFPEIEYKSMTYCLPYPGDMWTEITPEEFNEALTTASAMIAEKIDRLAQMCVNQEIMPIQPVPSTETNDGDQLVVGSETDSELLS